MYYVQQYYKIKEHYMSIINRGVEAFLVANIALTGSPASQNIEPARIISKDSGYTQIWNPNQTPLRQETNVCEVLVEGSEQYRHVMMELGNEGVRMLVDYYGDDTPKYLLDPNAASGIASMIRIIHADNTREPGKAISYEALHGELQGLLEAGLLDLYARIGVSIGQSAANDVARYQSRTEDLGFSSLTDETSLTLGISTHSVARNIILKSLQKDKITQFESNAFLNALFTWLDQRMDENGYIDLVNAWLGYTVGNSTGDPTRVGDTVEFGDKRREVVMNAKLVKEKLGQLGLLPEQQVRDSTNNKEANPGLPVDPNTQHRARN